MQRKVGTIENRGFNIPSYNEVSGNNQIIMQDDAD